MLPNGQGGRVPISAHSHIPLLMAAPLQVAVPLRVACNAAWGAVTGEGKTPNLEPLQLAHIQLYRSKQAL